VLIPVTIEAMVEPFILKLSDRRPMRDVQLKVISLRIHFIGALTHALRQQTRQLEDFRLFFLHNRSLQDDSFYPLDNSSGPTFTAARHMTFPCCHQESALSSGERRQRDGQH
jgi:hypothetical protein